MVEPAEIRRRLRAAMERARSAARERRLRADAAEHDGGRLLRQVVAPTFRAVASMLKAEGLPFRVSTPADAVRMTAEGSTQNFVELELDTTEDPPALRGRVGRTRGRRVMLDEHVVREGAAIGSMTEDDTLEFLLQALTPFLEK